MHEHLILGLVALVGLATGGQWLAHVMKVPTIVVLLVIGLLLGPGTGWLDPDELLGQLLFPFVSLGAALILFEGGLGARLRDLRQASRPLLRLVTIGLVLSWVGISTCAWWLLGTTPRHSALLGAILVVTGPTVIGPILRHARPTKKVARVLNYEGILNDPFGAVLAVLVFQVLFVEDRSVAIPMALWGVAKAALAATTIGLLAAFVYVQARRRKWLSDGLGNTVLLSLVLCSYALSGLIFPESGLLAVTVMGIALASQKRVPTEANLDFFEHVRTIILAILFVILAARIDRADLADLSLGAALFVAALIVVVRPLSVWLSTWGTDLSRRERVFISLVAPRGIVAAAVASVFALRLGEGAEQLLSVSFLSICTCVVVYGVLATPLARLLSLKEPEGKGVLILGANPIAVLVAEALQAEEIPVLLVDDERTNVRRARNLGLRVVHGRLLSERIQNRLDMDGLGQLIALTSNEDQNTLAVARFRPIFGDERVHQVRGKHQDVRDGLAYAEDLRGVTFAPELSFEQLESWASRARAKTTTLTEEFTYDDFKKHHGTTALAVLVVDAQDRVRTFGQDQPDAKPGERIVSLVRERDARRPDLASDGQAA